MTQNKNRCVITGLGMICAIGSSVDECWKNAVNGVSGIRETNSVNTDGCYANLSAEVHDGSLESLPHAAEMDRASQFCVKAAGEALRDAGLTVDSKNSNRVSVIMGSCVGGAASIHDFYENGQDASYVPKMPISAIANLVAQIYGAGGVVTNIANACAAGTISLAYACDLIRDGKADAAIAGGADTFSSIPYAGFISLHALDAQPCSPFNRCSGITLGEGSGALVVESYEHAVARGAKIYCEVLGSGISSDAHHITAPREDGEGQMNAIRGALAHSGLKPADIGYINAHGTGTGKNDMAEFLSLHTIFDGTAAQLSVSSTKAMVGHCLGAAGAIEAVLSVKALTEDTVPPTVGYTEDDLVKLADRAGKIDFCPNKSESKPLENVMSNSFAFGGNNASIVFSKRAGDVQIPEKKEKVYVTGLGIVSPAGNGIEAYTAKCVAGETPAAVSVESTVGPEDYAKCGLKMAFYRKLDRFSQYQAVSGMEALADANLTVTDENATDIGIVVGTSDGPLATVCNFQEDLTTKGNAAGSAFKFPNTVYNAAGGYLSICSGIKGYNVTVTNGAQSGLSGIAYAAGILRDGVEKTILATGTDESGEIMTMLYNKLGYVAGQPGAVYGGGNGFTLGDGSTTLVLESGSSVAARGARVYAEVAGTGMAHDSVKFGTLSGSENALEEAIRLACKEAGITPVQTDAVVGFGNGMKAVDDLELGVYRRVFGNGLTGKPIYTVKNTVGEGRAASAALSAAHASLLLSGNLVGAPAYAVTDAGVTTTVPDASAFRTVLVTSYAAGGSYCAVVLKKA